MTIKRIAVELSLCAAIGIAVATFISSAGDALSHRAAIAEIDDSATTWVVESDFSEPFVTCTTRAGVTTCRELDLLAGTR